MPLKPFTTRDLTIPGNGYDVNAPPFRFLRIATIVPATANIQVRLAEAKDNGAFFAFAVDARIERPLSEPAIPKLYVKSDTANTVVTFLISDTDKIIQDVEAGGGVVVLDPKNASGEVLIGGPQVFGHSGPIADNNMPVPVSMQWKRGPGTFQVSPFLSYDGEALAVGPGSSTVPGFLYSPGTTIPVVGYACLRVQVSTVDAGGLTFLDDYANKLPIYDADTGLNVGNAGITAGNNTGYYVPTAGVKNVSLVGAAGYSAWVNGSMVPHVPVKL